MRVRVVDSAALPVLTIGYLLDEIFVDTSGRLIIAPQTAAVVVPLKTYHVFAQSNLAASKNHLSILNNHATAVVKILSVVIGNAAIAAVTGLNTAFRLRSISAHSGGIGVTIEPYDNTNPAVPAGISAITGATTATLINDYGFATLSSEETVTQDDPKILFSAERNPTGQPLTCRTGEGFVVQQGALAVAAGTVWVDIVLTIE